MNNSQKLSPAPQVDWKKLRDDFFAECTEKPTGLNSELKNPRVIVAPHDLFEWFKKKLAVSAAPASVSAEEVLLKHIPRIPTYVKPNLIAAMKEYASQSNTAPSTEPLYRWVKASEKLPEISGWYSTRHGHHLSSTWFSLASKQFHNTTPFGKVTEWLEQIQGTVGSSEWFTIEDMSKMLEVYDSVHWSERERKAPAIMRQEWFKEYLQSIKQKA